MALNKINKLRTVIILCFLFSYKMHAQNWQQEFNCVAANNANTVGAKLNFIGSIPYLAFQDSDLGYKISVMKKNENTNTYVVVGTQGFSAGMASSIDTAVSSEELYVTYRDAGNSNKATVMKFNGTNWIPVGTPGFSSGSVESTTLCFIGTTPYVAFRDNANANKATVMSFNGTQWIAVGNVGFSASAVDQIQMRSDGSNLYVCYGDFANSNKITVNKFDGTNWITIGNAGFSVGVVQNPQLAFDGTTPYVSYTDSANNNKATVMKFNGISWVNVGEPGFTFGGTLLVQLAINDGVPYVAFGDVSNCGHQNVGRRISAMRYNGSIWEDFGNSCFTNTSINVYNTPYALVFNSNKAFVLSSALCSGFDTKLSMHSFDATLSINDFDKVKIAATPNPFSSDITLSGLTNKTYEYEIVNMMGKKIIAGTLKVGDVKINLSAINNGIYFLKLRGDIDSKTLKIIKN